MSDINNVNLLVDLKKVKEKYKAVIKKAKKKANFDDDAERLLNELLNKHGKKIDINTGDDTEDI